MAGKESESEAPFPSLQSLNLSYGGLKITCFSELVDDDVTLHFQIIRFPKQIYEWIGFNSAKLGDLYAAASTRPNNTVSVTSILGGSADNTGSGLARRLGEIKQ